MCVFAAGLTCHASRPYLSVQPQKVMLAASEHNKQLVFGKFWNRTDNRITINMTKLTFKEAKSEFYERKNHTHTLAYIPNSD